MRKVPLLIASAALCMAFCARESEAQSIEVPKFELAADFTSLSLSSGHTQPGLGARFTFNLNPDVAVEAGGYFFPGSCDSCDSEASGRIAEGLFGGKAGKRFQRWGVFGKVRPGFISFSHGAINILPTGGTGPFPFAFNARRRTNLVHDVGGVIEFYPSKRFVIRFDGGDTMIRYSRRTSNFLTTDPNTGAPVLVPFTTPAHTRHAFQFTAGVGFRF